MRLPKKMMFQMKEVEETSNSGSRKKSRKEKRKKTAGDIKKNIRKKQQLESTRFSARKRNQREKRDDQNKTEQNHRQDLFSTAVRVLTNSILEEMRGMNEERNERERRGRLNPFVLLFNPC